MLVPRAGLEPARGYPQTDFNGCVDLDLKPGTLHRYFDQTTFNCLFKLFRRAHSLVVEFADPFQVVHPCRRQLGSQL